MLEAVVECLVRRKITMKDYAKRCCMAFFDGVVFVILVLLTLNFPLVLYFFFLAVALLVWVTYLVFRNTNIEYEYSFFDGDLQVDKILNKKARKKLHTFPMSKMEFMAPEGSHHLGGQAGNRKQYDYSANNEELKNYVAVLYDEKNQVSELKFTPNEELFNRLKNTYARKVYED